MRPIDVSAEYKELVDAVHGRGAYAHSGAGEAYQRLMAKERRVLDTIDRVVNDAVTTDGDPRPLLSLPLYEIGMRIMGAIRGAMDDSMEASHPRDVLRAVFRDDRKIYIGLFILAIGILMAIVAG